MTTLTTLFADGVLDAQIRNGVARVTLGQLDGEGRGVPTGQLVLPLGQLPSTINSLVRLWQEFENRSRQAAAAAAQPGAPAPAAAPEPPPPAGGAFRFGQE
ncbi:hypothetical protein [Roseomonas sp. BN140053]|uniref:hypothetical protein n=1 Tax=Roseomonas sp. BN140053 TaxID=3391898 RepID=UPI0039ED603B